MTPALPSPAKYLSAVAMAVPLFIAGPSAAQQQAAPLDQSGAPVERVIVTAPSLRSDKVLNDFVQSHAAPSLYLGKIARWKTRICPITDGLSPELDRFIRLRIVQVALMAGAPVATASDCRPNIAVLVTPQPEALLDFAHNRRPYLLGGDDHFPGVMMKRPIQAWYSTATEDFYGFVEADVLGSDITTALPGAAGIPGGVHVSGYRTGDGLKSQFSTALIVVDANKIAGRQIGALADYIAMLAISQAKDYDACQLVPSITNLMAPDCDSAKPDGITDVDIAYLRGLYKMDAGSNLGGERASIAFEMKKDLEGR